MSTHHARSNPVYIRCRLRCLSNLLRSGRYSCTYKVCQILYRWMYRRDTAYSPPFALFAPKLLPTMPLQRQDWPAALVHDAVAVAPTLRQDIARLSTAGDAETRVAKRAVRERLRRCMLGFGFVGSGRQALPMILLPIVSKRLFRC
jgi:hypothetical protein